MDGILLPDGGTHELVEGPTLEGHHVLMDLCAEPLVEQDRLLLLPVDVV
jgi:hypothetical protein